MIRDDKLKNAGAKQVLEEARRAADAYLIRSGAAPIRGRKRPWGLIIAAAGTVTAGVLWAAFRFIGM